MTVLYAVAQSHNGRVANTCNLSEDWVGYSTRYGDSVGDFSPLSFLTVEEVKAIGRVLGLPSMFVDKAPSDGLCGKTDEEKTQLLLEAVDKLMKDIELPNSIKEFIEKNGYTEKDFYDKLDEMVELAFDDQCTGANPVYPLMEDIKKIYIDAFNGVV